MKQKIAILEDQLKAKSTKGLENKQETQISNSTPPNHKEMKSQKRHSQQTNSKDAITDLQQTCVQHPMKTVAIKEENIKLQQELKKIGYQYDDVVAQNNLLRWDTQELRNALKKAKSELQLFKTDLQLQEKTSADLSANNDRAYKYKSERDFAVEQVKNLQGQLQLLHQTLSTQSEMYNIDQSKANRRIKILEAECTYLQNENVRLDEVVNAKPRPGTHHRQFSESDQTLFDTLPLVDVPVNSRFSSHEYQLNDGAMQTPYMHSCHSRQPSESTESSSENESYGSSTNMCECHDCRHGYQHTDNQYTDTSIRPGSLSQDHHHSRRNSYVSCNWQQDDMLENSMSLSQPTTDGYMPDMVIIRGPKSLSQEYDQFYENTTCSPWTQYGMPSYSSRSLPKELDRSTSHLPVYRSSSLGSRMTSQHTTHFYKKVVTAHGELDVKCEAIHMMSELYIREKVVVHRYYHNIHEYGIVRALNVTNDNKPWYVGIELDLPGLYANVRTCI